MTGASSFGAVLAWPFLLPGNLVCQAFGLPQSEYSDLIRMLVNSLVWTVAGVCVVAFIA